MERLSEDLSQPGEPSSLEIGCYASSLALEEHDDEAMLGLIRGHWSAIENGTHYRRDVSLGEDACRASEPAGATALACFRNLTIGLYELEKERGRTRVDSLKSWCQQQTFSTGWKILQR